MPVFHDITSLVEDDVVEGLGDAFSATSGFSVLPHFSAKNIPVGEVTFVPWRYVGTHVGDFYGIAASNREVEVVGATAVEDPESEAPTFTRFIDWANVLAQMGATISARTIGSE